MAYDDQYFVTVKILNLSILVPLPHRGNMLPSMIANSGAGTFLFVCTGV